MDHTECLLRWELRWREKQRFLQSGGEQGRHGMALGKRTRPSDWDRSSCRAVRERGRFFHLPPFPSESEFRQHLDRSPEESAGRTRLKHGIRAHLAGSFSTAFMTSTLPGPYFQGHQIKGKINPKALLCRFVVQKLKKIWFKRNMANYIREYELPLDKRIFMDFCCLKIK